MAWVNKLWKCYKYRNKNGDVMVSLSSFKREVCCLERAL